ncbi:Hypothetical protein R9X50_00571400 [Acrodontium crateriforme]|uniref:Uncharacterized protein n=1 Tax=Acrodontium crateriforme TaxID=150365 RepID=A0AAQ3MA85_9PEZI|nr:Hypothetical protein R9X50_00571400 [Acrodontium crateriforme]
MLPWPAAVARRGIGLVGARPLSRPWRPSFPHASPSAYSSVAFEQPGDPLPLYARKFNVFQQLPFPKRDRVKDVQPWLDLLESSLPLHLRRKTSSSYDSDQAIDATGVAEILLAAQGTLFGPKGVDLLCHLGVEQDRWDTVIWLVKHLVENLGDPNSADGKGTRVHHPWSQTLSFDRATEHPIFLDTVTQREDETRPQHGGLALDHLTDSRKFQRKNTIRHNALGQVWRSLGSMILACTDGVVKPEILEIIAYLHHHEIMPMSIYNHKPTTDPTTIQQPPTLHLLSSRILTSLSDAAWRAHEETIVKSAKAKGGRYASLRPEIPGTAYRVRVAGIRAEIWLELVLWSCLHGGWVIEGSAILASAYEEPVDRQWKPLSWRSLIPAGYEDFSDWDGLAHLYNTITPPRGEQTHDVETSVERTVSSEVINAFVDALLTQLDAGVGERGTPSLHVLLQLQKLQKFLHRCQLNLGGGSWDAVILRFVDSQRHGALQMNNLLKLLKLSPAFGQETKSLNTRYLPSYILDGSAAVICICHRAIQAEVQAGNIKGALAALQQLRFYTDDNKRVSLHEFFSGPKPSHGLFTANYSRIEYPAFDPRLPVATLGSLMELIVDSKELEIGKWLIYSKEVDGPLITPELYTHPAITAPLIRFAVETNDRDLLAKVIKAPFGQYSEGKHPIAVTEAFLDVQFSLRRWAPAVRLLEHSSPERNGGGESRMWTSRNLAQLSRAILFLEASIRTSENPSKSMVSDLHEAQQIFADMVRGKYGAIEQRSDESRKQVYIVLLTLSTLNTKWAQLCRIKGQPTKHLICPPFTHEFNKILDGTVRAYGSAAGRRLLGIFWSHELRNSQRQHRNTEINRSGMIRVSRLLPKVLENPKRERNVVHISDMEDEAVIYGGLEPDPTTINIILTEAAFEMRRERKSEGKQMKSHTDNNQAAVLTENLVEELHIMEHTQDEKGEAAANAIDISPTGMIVWAMKRLREFGIPEDDIWTDLEASLQERDLRRIRRKWNIISNATNPLG